MSTRGLEFDWEGVLSAIDLRTESHETAETASVLELANRAFERFRVNPSSEMYRASAVDRVPAGGVGRTEELDLETQARGRFGPRSSDDTLGRGPGRAAGGAAHDRDLGDIALVDSDLEIGCAELLSVCAEADLPPETASRRWTDGCTLDRYLLP